MEEPGEQRAPEEQSGGGYKGRTGHRGHWPPAIDTPTKLDQMVSDSVTASIGPQGASEENFYQAEK